MWLLETTRAAIIGHPSRSAICVLLLIVLHFLISRFLLPEEAQKRGLKAIPGPRTNLLGDNSFQFSPVSPFLAFQKWAKEFGPIFKVTIGSQTIISVNDPKLAKELFEKRGGKFSSRNSPHVGSELLSQGRRIAFIPSGAMHAAFRRQMHLVLSISRTKENHKIQELESRQALHELLQWAESPVVEQRSSYGDIQASFRRYTLSVMMTLGYGHRVKSLGEDAVKMVFEIMDDMSRTIQPGQYLVDIFPSLKKLPYFLRTWEHDVNRKLKWQWPFMKGLQDRTQYQMDLGIPNPGLVRALLERRKDLSEQERVEQFLDDRCMAYQAMTLMEAGADTTSIVLMNFTAAMLLNPHVMRKGQEAVDAIVPESRMPTFEDLPRMNYINQIVKEVMRWRAIINMAIPHSNPEEAEINGYHIPKNSIIFGNVWAMQHDPNHYKNPEAFYPERYDGNTKSTFESSLEADPMNRDHYVFGWGRRICPGIHLAEASVLLFAARLLWAFDMNLAKDGEGREIPVSCDPATAYYNSIITNPKVFPLSLKPRSQARAQTIRELYQDALKKWEEEKLDLFAEWE
ncbi:hypothetical protein H2200_007373 [Cladophialophora chaetospira]|uniref:Cytochrome P450 n=1 Tax=Cladophialophora chaetospira TaxID=386627 RepID=A0AA38X7N9_9EURO|nr:hypothetical protein H2200_007373 [Cladophialophora chaetospira]